MKTVQLGRHAVKVTDANYAALERLIDECGHTSVEKWINRQMQDIMNDRDPDFKPDGGRRDA